MSYIKIEFGPLKVDEKGNQISDSNKRGFKFNQLALEIIRSKSNPASDIQNVYALFYGGLRGNSFVKEEEPDYSFEQVTDWVDELYLRPEAGEVIKSVSDVFTSTQMYQALIKEPEAEKKSSRKKKSS